MTGFGILSIQSPISQNKIMFLKKYFESQTFFRKGIDRKKQRVYIADKYFETQNI